MEKNITANCEHSAKDFKKLGKVITKLAEKQNLIAIKNRMELFIDGKPCRRWWFADKKNGLLLSVEYGLVDKEAVNFLTNDIPA